MAIQLGDTFSFDQSMPATCPPTDIAKESRTSIAILGAGLAGLTCAYRLAKDARRMLDSMDVTILERERQPGGRVRSLDLGDAVLNLGAVTFQPDHYRRYGALLVELGLSKQVRIIPRTSMIFGYNGRTMRADTRSLIGDGLRSLAGRGVFSPDEIRHLVRFYLYLQRVTAPEHEDELMQLHEMSVAEWARGFGMSASLRRKFVEPFTRFSFRAPEDVSAAFGVFLLGFNLSRPATLVGGFGQVTDALAEPVAHLLVLGATAIAVDRVSEGFSIIYRRDDRLYRLTSRYLVVAVPPTVAADLVPDMRSQAGTVAHGVGRGCIIAGQLKREVDGELHLHVVDRPAGTVIFGGEVRRRPNGGHYANVLTYRGVDAAGEAIGLFHENTVDVLAEYPIFPASAAPSPGQRPLSVDWGDGLYMAGDGAGLFPSQETAVRSGEDVADLLQGKLHND